MLAIIAAIDNDLQREFISDVYIKYYNSARAKAFTFVHDEFEAEEIIQEVFVKLIEHIDVLMELNESSLSFYVMVTTKNTAIKHWKKSKEKAVNYSFDSEEDLSKWADDRFALPEDLYEKQEELEALAHVISKLPERDKALLESKYILQLSDKEIAKELDLAPQSVRSFLTRARRKAYAILKGEIEDE